MSMHYERRWLALVNRGWPHLLIKFYSLNYQNLTCAICFCVFLILFPVRLSATLHTAMHLNQYVFNQRVSHWRYAVLKLKAAVYSYTALCQFKNKEKRQRVCQCICLHHYQDWSVNNEVYIKIILRWVLPTILNKAKAMFTPLAI